MIAPGVTSIRPKSPTSQVGDRFLKGTAMEPDASAPQRNKAGIVSATVGWIFLVLTMVLAGGSWLTATFPYVPVVMAVILGALFTLPPLLIALALVTRARKKLKTLPEPGTSFPALKWARAGLAACLILSLLLAVSSCFRERHWVEEAQAAVEDSFREGSDLGASGSGNMQSGRTAPASIRAEILSKFGPLQRIEGSGYSYPFWNIQGYEYLTAHRTAVFARGRVQLKLYVTEGGETAPGQRNVSISSMDRDYSGLTVMVAHPRLGPWLSSSGIGPPPAPTVESFMRFYKATGEPVPDVTVRVPDLQLIGTSDGNGQIRCKGLPPDQSIRWVCSSHHIADAEPILEPRIPGLLRDEFGRNMWRGDDVSLTLSYGGSFSTKPGDRRVLEFRILDRAGLFARLLDRNGKAVPEAEVMVLDCLVDEDRWYILKERASRTDAGGGFRFKDLRPGKKWIEARWMSESGTRLHVARATADLGSGESRDLGTLAPPPGHMVQGVVRFDRPDLVAKFPERNSAIQVRFKLKREGAGREDIDWIATLSPRIGEPFFLSDLPPGRLIVYASVGYERPGVRPRLTASPQILVEVPDNLQFEIVIKVEEN